MAAPRNLIKSYIGIFVLRENKIVQSFTELYTGPFEIQVHQIVSGESRCDTTHITAYDLPLHAQATRYMSIVARHVDLGATFDQAVELPFVAHPDVQEPRGRAHRISHIIAPR